MYLTYWKLLNVDSLTYASTLLSRILIAVFLSRFMWSCFNSCICINVLVELKEALGLGLPSVHTRHPNLTFSNGTSMRFWFGSVGCLYIGHAYLPAVLFVPVSLGNDFWKLLKHAG